MQAPLLHIFFSNQSEALQIHKYLATEDRLAELVLVQPAEAATGNESNVIFIDEGRLVIPPEWLDKRPGVVFAPNIIFNKKCFLGAVFGLLGNQAKMQEYLAAAWPRLANSFRLLVHLQGQGHADHLLESLLDDTNFTGVYDGYTFNHNVAIGLNYGSFSIELDPRGIEAHYLGALEAVWEPVLKASTTYFYAHFLMDMGKAYEAAKLIEGFPAADLPEYARYALRRIHCHCFVATLSLPLDREQMPAMKQYLWETLTFYSERKHNVQAGQLYLDAAHVATLDGSYSEALGYISKAINGFEEEGQEELAGQAKLEKGRLLLTWAQAGNPQFYRQALAVYQELHKLFNREDAPDVFAEIHHQLGIIYAELPDEQSKRSIWASVSVTSFNEALDYFTLQEYPLEYGMICNNFGNAWTKYPAAVNSDNFQTALGYYSRALVARPAQVFPRERVMTLLNYLETAWKAGNEGDSFNSGRYFDMKEKAEEVLALTEDEALRQEAQAHLTQLENLKTGYEKAGENAINTD